MNARTILLAGAFALGAAIATAQTPTKSAADHPGMQTASMSEGEVRKVDKGAKKITLKHGEIKNLGMPNMTVVFRGKGDEDLSPVPLSAGDPRKNLVVADRNMP